MKIAFLTTDEPLYLPTFFQEVLPALAPRTVGVYVVPPLYRDQTTLDAARRYAHTFGWRDAASLAARVAEARMRRRSIASVCAAVDVMSRDAADVNSPEFLDDLRELEPDLLVSVSCPQIFKRPLLDLAPAGCLNIHGALLPRYRGVLPSFWMMANGERYAGVSIYYVNEAIDAGELCAQRSFPIEPGDSLDSFLHRSKAIAAELLLETVGAIEDGSVRRTPLDLTEGSYFSWPDTDAVARFRALGRSGW